MKEVMVSGYRSEGVGWLALFFSELVQPEVYKIFIGKYGKQKITQLYHLPCS